MLCFVDSHSIVGVYESAEFEKWSDLPFEKTAFLEDLFASPYPTYGGIFFMFLEKLYCHFTNWCFFLSQLEWVFIFFVALGILGWLIFYYVNFFYQTQLAYKVLKLYKIRHPAQLRLLLATPVMVQAELTEKIRPGKVGTLERSHKFWFLRIVLDLSFSFWFEFILGVELYVGHYIGTSKGLVV